MKIVIVYQYYQGQGAPGHSLIYEHAQYLAKRGHDVTVVTGETGYMKCDVATLPWYRRILRKEYDGRVKVIRTYSYVELHRSYFGRLLSFISFSLSCPLALLFVNRPDIVLASSPPIFPVFFAWLVSVLRGTPFVVEVRDLWPASAVQMGILKNKALIKIMAWMEGLLYKNSQAIVSLTQGIFDDIGGRCLQDKRLELITCGVDVDKLYPDPVGASSVRESRQWDKNKVIMYFGALGEANNISVILRAAQRLKDRTDILFVLIGDGMMRDSIHEEILKSKLHNVQILPPVPKSDARIYIGAADLCLVTLQDISLFNGAIPTKLIDYMACGKPVLCGVRGEALRIVDEASSGICFEPNDDLTLSQLVIDLLNDKQRIITMGEKGRQYVSKKFTIIEMCQKMEKVLQDIVNINNC